MIEKALKDSVVSICNDMRYYESGWISIDRTPAGIEDREKCFSIKQYIECRINHDLFFIPEFQEYEKMMDGYLFDVIEVKGENPEKKRFDEFTIVLRETPETYIGDRNFWEVHEEVCKLLGPEKKITFTWGHAQSRVKVKFL